MDPAGWPLASEKNPRVLRPGKSVTVMHAFYTEFVVLVTDYSGKAMSRIAENPGRENLGTNTIRVFNAQEN